MIVEWLPTVFRKEIRTRWDGNAMVWEYRINGGDWVESGRLVFA